MNPRYDYRHDYSQDFHDEWDKNIKKVRTCAIVIAILMIVIGVLCIIFPSDSFTVVIYLAGIVLCALGIAQLIGFYRAPIFMRDPLIILNGIFAILVAILLFASPVAATASVIGYVLAFLLLSSGFEKLGLGWRIGFFTEQKHGWITFSAVLDIIMAVLFFIMPIAGITAVGYLIAAFLIVAGIAILIECVSFKREED